MTSFSADEKERYARHFVLPEVGVCGQAKLLASAVLCVGAGGLGSSALMYLAAAGVGRIGIVDADSVELSNLQRQTIYHMNDVGRLKVDAAKDRLHALNPALSIETYPTKLNEENVFEIFSSYDVVVDATDNYAARYLINDACFVLQKPDVFACVLRFLGQCSVFGGTGGPCYRCLYPNPPPSHFLPNCRDAGVLGVLPGILGCLQANEVLKWLLKIGQPLVGRMTTFNALSGEWNTLSLAPNPECPLCAKKMKFSDLSRSNEECNMTQATPEITVDDFKKMQQEGQDYFLLDVREHSEFEEENLNGYLIPLGELPDRVAELDKNKLIVIHCKAGGRSNQAGLFLLNHGFSNVCHLKGGIMAWLKNS